MPSNPVPAQVTDRPRSARQGFRPSFLLYSYVANELLAPFFASFLILYAVFFLVRLIPLLDVVLTLRIGLADFIRLFAYIFPNMLLYIIPMASMAGVIVGFTRLTNDREILAFKACGVSLKHMLPPVLLLTAAIACLTGLFSIRLIPAGALGVKQLMFELAKEKVDKGLKAKEFTEALGDIVVYVDSIDEQRRWHGVYVSDMRGRTQPLITVAKSGHMDADMERMLVTVALEDGTMHNNQGMDNQVIRFKHYQLHVSLRPPTQIGKEDVTFQSRGAMTQEQLQHMAGKEAVGSRASKTYLSEYHMRLILPVGCFILSLIGVPLGLQASPGRRAVGLPLGLAVFLSYYISLTTCRNLSEQGFLPLVVGLWLPNMVFLALAIYLFWRANKERPLAPDWMMALGYGLFQRYLAPWGHHLGCGVHRLSRRLLGRRIAASDVTSTPRRSLAIRANAETKVFHLPQCPYYKDSDCRLRFKSVAVAKAAGFHPCDHCKGFLNDETAKPSAP